MKIHIDINHPAHVHYFRNFIKHMEAEGYSFVLTNRDDELINYLLDHYKIDHIVRNRRKNNSGSKLVTLWYLFVMTFHVLKNARRHKVDAFLGFASSSCSIVSFLMRKPSVILDDTEHNKFNHLLYTKFATAILTPFYFSKKLRFDQIYFDAYIEQLYLERCPSSQKDDYIFLRFIAYDAGHDSCVNIDEIEIKRKLIIDLLSPHYRLVISCEGEALKEKYKNYQGDYNPEEVHDVMLNAKFVISDGATMASETGILGTPYVYTNPLQVGYLVEQSRNFENAFIMSYDVLIEELEKDISFYLAKTTSISTTSIKYINPTQLLLWLFKDLDNNIKAIKGEHVTLRYFEQLQVDTNYTSH